MGFFWISIEDSRQNACVPRSFGYDSVVCVCNSTYCDSTPRFVPHKGQYAFYQTSRAGQRLGRKIGNLQNRTVHIDRSTMISVTFRPNEKYQTMHGFGGAFTDATGINIMRMSQKSQQNIIQWVKRQTKWITCKFSTLKTLTNLSIDIAARFAFSIPKNRRPNEQKIRRNNWKVQFNRIRNFYDCSIKPAVFNEFQVLFRRWW